MEELEQLKKLVKQKMLEKLDEMEKVKRLEKLVKLLRLVNRIVSHYQFLIRQFKRVLKKAILDKYDRLVCEREDKFLEVNLMENFWFPFRREKRAFVMDFVHRRFWLGCLLLMTARMFTNYTFKHGALDLGTNRLLGWAGAVFTWCISLWLIWYGTFRRRLVIDTKTKQYWLYVGNVLQKRGPVRHLCILLRRYTRYPREGWKYRVEMRERMKDVILLTECDTRYWYLHYQAVTLARRFGCKCIDDWTPDYVRMRSKPVRKRKIKRKR